MLDLRANELQAGAGSPTVTAGADALLVAANQLRQGLQVCVDAAATGNVYLLLVQPGTSGAASASNFHVCLGPGGCWDGTVGPQSGGVLWTGAVRFFGSGQKLGVAEV